MLAAVRRKQPTAILEVGAWDGGRAEQMLAAAPLARYYGFDLFEDATPDTDAAEMNVKRHHSLAEVQRRLGERATLVRGNTRQTLAAFTTPVDFVWLDGGHSVETIESDWANVLRVLLPGAEVYFDDYYTGAIDTTKFGCNRIVERWDHQVLPQKDPVRGGGWVQMVRVWP